MNFAILGRYFRVRKSALALSVVATLGVVFFGVLWGIAIAVILAILLFFRRNWWPHGAVLGRVDGLPGWHNVDTYPDAQQIPDVVVFRWEAPLFFANANLFRQRIRHLVRDRHPSWVVLQCEAITDIDVTAAEMLEALDKELDVIGVHLAFAELRDRLQALTLRYGLFETLDRDHFYPTLKAAVKAVEDIRASAADARGWRSRWSAGTSARERRAMSGLRPVVASTSEAPVRKAGRLPAVCLRGAAEGLSFHYTGRSDRVGASRDAV